MYQVHSFHHAAKHGTAHGKGDRALPPWSTAQRNRREPLEIWRIHGAPQNLWKWNRMIVVNGWVSVRIRWCILGCRLCCARCLHLRLWACAQIGFAIVGTRVWLFNIYAYFAQLWSCLACSICLFSLSIRSLVKLLVHNHNIHLALGWSIRFALLMFLAFGVSNMFICCWELRSAMRLHIWWIHLQFHHL